jgi:hypothetical protein
VAVRIDVRVEDDLRETLAITKVDEYDASVISPSVYPTHEDDFEADIGNSQISAIMGSFLNCQKIRHSAINSL